MKYLSLPGTVYSRVLERRIRLIVEPRIQEEQCGFRPGHGTLDQLYTLCRVLEGSWEFAQPVHMCFVDLEKAFDRVHRGILWEVLREYGVRGPLLRAVRSLYYRSWSLVRIAGSKSDLFPVNVALRQGCSLSPVLFIFFYGKPRTRWSDYVTWLAWERLGILLEELEEVSGEREIWVSLLRQLPPVTRPRITWKKMDGWMGGFYKFYHWIFYSFIFCIISSM